MSTRREAQTDSDGSWTWVDNEDDNFRQRAARRRASSYTRPEVEEIESDVSILTDPEENVDAAAPAAAEGAHAEGAEEVPTAEEKVKQTNLAKEMQEAYSSQIPPAPPGGTLAQPGVSELAEIDRRSREYIRSTLTSAGLMIAGLLLAVYFQWGCDGNYSSPIQEYYDEPYNSKGDIEYIPPAYKHSKYNHEGKKYEAQRHAERTHKNAKEKFEKYESEGKHGKKKLEYNNDQQKKSKKKGDYNDEHQKNKKKGDFKPKKEKFRGDFNDDSDEHVKKHKKEQKHDKGNAIKKQKKQRQDDSDERDDYLHKKEAYLKHKESKLKQRELKLHASEEVLHKHKRKDKGNTRSNATSSSSGEWYEKRAKGRKDKRKQEGQSDWVFERAQGRDKKRDKAHWYFDMMDEREASRMKHRS